MKAVFLDRDGVINRDTGYVYMVEQIEFLPGIFECTAALERLGYQLVIVSNQAGVARGLYTEEDVKHLHRWMVEQFQRRGVTIARSYFCPHHPQGVVPAYSRDCEYRKPAPGMIFKAQRELGLNLPECALVGNMPTDIAAGRAAGVGTTILVQLPGNPTGMDAHASAVVTSLEEVSALLARAAHPQPPRPESGQPA